MQKIHSLLFFLFIVNIGLIAQPIPENNKVLILNFDDNTLVDESQNNHQIINRGTSFSTGIRAEGIELDGIDNYLEVELEVEHEPSLLIPENVTMSVWYQHVDQKDTRFYSLIEQSTPENGGHSRYGTWIFDVNRIQTCVEPDICPSLCQRCVSSEGIELQDRQWYHIVTTYDGLFLKIYIDGELNIERNFGTMTDISTRPQPLTIGTDIFGSPNFLKGKLDEIGLYNIALNEDQIQTLFNQTSFKTRRNIHLPQSYQRTR